MRRRFFMGVVFVGAVLASHRAMVPAPKVDVEQSFARRRDGSFELQELPAVIRPTPIVGVGRSAASAVEDPGIKIVVKREPKSKRALDRTPRVAETAVSFAVDGSAEEGAEWTGHEQAPAAVPERPVEPPSQHAGLLESLRLAAEPEERILFGAPSVSEASSDIDPVVTGRPTPTPAPEQTPVAELPMVTGQPRGYAMLYLMQPAARRTAEKEIEIMLRARLGQHYLGVLTDGTFGRDFDYLASVIVRLNESPLTLALYLTNGATMRKWDQTPITAGFNRMEPDHFRLAIRYDHDTREKFRSMVADVKPLFDLNRRLNPGSRNLAIVMLEDNLDRESYYEMREIARTVLGDLVKFVRNPCPGCYSGNDSDGLGDPLELHRPEDLPNLNAGDGFTLDGTGIAYPGQTANGGILVADAMELAAFSQGRGIGYFGLWRFERQGLVSGNLAHPDERIYEVPTEEQAEQEIQLLRHGLSLMETQPR